MGRLDNREPAPQGLPVAGQGCGPRAAMSCNWVIFDYRVSERAEPPMDCRDLAAIDVGGPVPGNEADSTGNSAGRLSVADGAIR